MLEKQKNITDKEKTELIRTALNKNKYSYAPYSHYNVSAAVLTDDGSIYYGVNVENVSYPAGICAERNAVFHAVSEGHTKICAIALCGGKNGIFTDYCSPCGICRQVMREFSNPFNFKVIMAKSENDYKEMTLEELLPESFGPNALK